MLDRDMLGVLDAVADYDRPKIQESVFVNKYLPYFSGKAGKDGAIAVWLDVAGSPYAEVHVCNGTQLLFTVPPLLNPDRRVLGRLNEISLHAALEQVQLHYNVAPALGENRMHEWIISRLGTDLIGLDLARRWNEIFKRYNLPLVPLPDDPSTHAKTDSGTAEECIFDDF